MANFDVYDVHFQNVQKDCSPNIIKFILGLNDSTENNSAHLNYPLLRGLGCEMFDGRGKFFRCISFTTSDGSVQSPGWRSYREQFDIYKRGRKASVSNYSLRLTVNGVSVPKILQGSWSECTFTEKTGTIYTNALPGASYHNYGLAVDICLRKFGDSGTIPAELVKTIDGVKFDTLRKVYEKTGILAWAKKCGLTWGGDWADFPDFGHFQDTAFKPLPDTKYADGLLALRNSSSCSFEYCRDFWAGKYDKELKDFEKKLKESGISEPSSGEKKLGVTPFLLLLLGVGAVLFLKKRRFL